MKLAPVRIPKPPRKRGAARHLWDRLFGNEQPPVAPGYLAHGTNKTRKPTPKPTAAELLGSKPPPKPNPLPTKPSAPSRPVESNPFLIPPKIDTFRPPAPEPAHPKTAGFTPDKPKPPRRRTTSRKHKLPKPISGAARSPRPQHHFPAPPTTPRRRPPVPRPPGLSSTFTSSSSSRYGVSVPIRAVAVAHEESNAVGTLELTCTPSALRIDFIQISAFREGYVPYPSTISEQVEVPYEAIAKVTTDDNGLVYLTLDRAYTTFNKLALAGLVHDRNYTHAIAARRRRKLETRLLQIAMVSWIPIALLLSIVAPSVSAFWRFAIAMTTAGLLATFRREIAVKLALFGPKNAQVSAHLLNELRWRLPAGRVQVSAAVIAMDRPAKPDQLGPDTLEPGHLKSLFTTAGIVAGLSVIAILIGKNLLLSSPPLPAKDPWRPLATQQVSDESNRAGSPRPSASQPTRITRDSTPAPAPLVPCSCARSDSPLWATGIPRMSVLTRNRPGKTSYDRPSVYPEIAVVNNSNKDLKDIVMIVDFLLNPRDGHKGRVLGKKDLFWEGVLPPGKAVKWRVRGRGDDFAVTSFVQGRLGQNGVEPAPKDAFYKLATTAHTPMVRVHGAKMLAYLGDKRTTKVLRKLQDEHRSEQQDTLAEIERASGLLRVCGVHVDRDAAASSGVSLPVSACVFNAGSQPVEEPFVEAVAELQGRRSSQRWTIHTTLQPNRGVLVSNEIEAPPGDDDISQATVRVTAAR